MNLLIMQFSTASALGTEFFWGKCLRERIVYLKIIWKSYVDYSPSIEKSIRI
jgi:hypothetical protein